MRVTTVCSVAALAFTVVAIGLRQEVYRVGAPPQREVLQTPGGPPNTILSGRELPGDPRLLNDANLNSSDTSAANTRPQPKAPSLSAPDATAVIGRAFPISKAIEAGCKRLQDYTCNDVQEKLLEMSREPRDSEWASQMEALIERDILFKEPGKYQIRDIECRTTLCAAEVESLSSTDGAPSYMAGMQLGHDALNSALHTNFNAFAFETDASGARVIVTVITFSRL